MPARIRYKGPPFGRAQGPLEDLCLTKDRFDCIVVGAGFAGCSAAIRLAQQGVDVLLVERADEGGAKNLSGGILWGDDLAKILPDWRKEMPFERPVTNKKIGFLGDKTAFVMDYHDETWKQDQIGVAVLRAKSDKWLVEQARKAGATVVMGVDVEGLYKVNGRIQGVVQGGEVTHAAVVIIADGANSRLTLEGDLRHGQKKLDMHHYALGVKEVLKLDKATLEDRFGVGADGGMAGEFVVGRQDGVMAGGFLYTNKDTLSLGVVIHLESMKGKGELTTHDVIEEFRLHPYIAALTKDAELVEYGAHLVPEGGYQSFSELYADGALVVGDAAGFCFSNGISIQGMNYAVRSGICAADAVVHALKVKDASAVTLRRYEQNLEADGVISDFKNFKNVGRFVWNPRLFQKYPALFSHAFRGMLGAEGPKRKLRVHLMDAMKKAGVSKREAVGDALRAGVDL
jgi:electron transfer flavoprotein-quinone oxidoreductase